MNAATPIAFCSFGRLALLLSVPPFEPPRQMRLGRPALAGSWPLMLAVRPAAGNPEKLSPFGGASLERFPGVIGGIVTRVGASFVGKTRTRG